MALSKGWLGSATSYTVPDLSSQLSYTPLSGSVSVAVGAFISPHALDLTDPFNADLASFGATTDISYAQARGSYTVGGGSTTFP